MLKLCMIKSDATHIYFFIKASCTCKVLSCMPSFISSAFTCTKFGNNHYASARTVSLESEATLKSWTYKTHNNNCVKKHLLLCIFELGRIHHAVGSIPLSITGAAASIHSERRAVPRVCRKRTDKLKRRECTRPDAISSASANGAHVEVYPQRCI